MARINKAKDLIYHKAYREANRALLRVKSKAYYAANIEKERIRSKLKDKKKTAVRVAKYQKNNKAKRAANEAKRRFAKQRATPKWLTAEQNKEILSFYEIANDLSWLSDDGLEVDHIVPLKNDLVSGLHVPWNLRVISSSMNRIKYNKLVV